jgi:hypothetical protein
LVKLMRSVATPIVATLTQDAVISEYEPRESTRHDVGKRTPSVATPTQACVHEPR